MRPYFNSLHNTTLPEILAVREWRCDLQRKLLATYHSTLISFTMNVAGPFKSTPLIERAFLHGMSVLLDRIPSSCILFRYSALTPQGYTAFIAVALDASTVKGICVNIEESSKLGRLFDMDVIDENGTKLERKNQRGCIVCGKAGRECSAGRLHTVEKIVAASNEIMTEHFANIDFNRIAALATEALIQEVETTPKPGLVDLRNSGSHSDMSASTFRRSARALKPYFAECIEIGAKSKTLSFYEAFDRLRAAGVAAENTMYSETNGINTHKGIIYSMGALLGAIGRNWTPFNPKIDISTIVAEAAKLVRESVVTDFSSATGDTHGEKLFLEHGLKGIRGEVSSGFPSVIAHSLPAYKASITTGMSQNDAGIYALLKLISHIDDTNLYHRGGASGASYAKRYASRLLEKDLDIKEVEKMDDEFIKRNLSPGGAADLLAITYFLYSIEQMK